MFSNAMNKLQAPFKHTLSDIIAIHEVPGGVTHEAFSTRRHILHAQDLLYIYYHHAPVCMLYVCCILYQATTKIITTRKQ